MKHLLSGALAIVIVASVATSCHSSDYADDENSAPATTTSNDTTMAEPTNSNAKNSTVDVTPNEVSKDSVATASPATTPTTATPNPAKKGKKGSVIINAENKTTGDAETVDKEGYYTNVYPAYPGGANALASFFEKNIQYPADASDNGVEGTVNLSFTVDETGKVGKPQVTSQRLGYGLEEEATRVFGKMPAWKPGSLKGKNVKTRFTLPVKFTLTD